MFQQGFLGTRADFLFDLIVVSLALIVPLLAYSVYLVRFKKNYRTHKRIQLGISLVVGVVLILFEIDLYLKGGLDALMQGSSYKGTQMMSTILNIHLSFSISTALLWPLVLIHAYRIFPTPPRPVAASPRHRILGWFALVGMLGTGVTGILVYLYLFVY